MIVTILGSGSAWPTARRSSAGYLVEWSGGQLIMDPSAGAYMRALKSGLDPAALKAVALTHFHPDHTADLPGLFFARRQADLPTLRVAGPGGTRELVADLDAEAITYPCEIEGLLIEAFPAQHSPEAVCLRLAAGGKTLAFSGDSEDCPGLRDALRGADLALLECSVPQPKSGHLTPEKCRVILAETRPRQALLTHLGPDVDPGELPTAEDGMVVAL